MFLKIWLDETDSFSKKIELQLNFVLIAYPSVYMYHQRSAGNGSSFRRFWTYVYNLLKICRLRFNKFSIRIEIISI